MNTTARRFTTNSTDSHERCHSAVGRPILAYEWKLSSEGEITGRWLRVSRAPGTERCAWMSTHPCADASHDEAQTPRRLQTMIGWITIGALLAISVCATIVCFTVEPIGLF